MPKDLRARRRIEPGSRVLVVRPGALGDTVLSLPAIRILRRLAGSQGRIELVGYPTPLQLAVNHLHADSLHSIDRAVFAGLFSQPRSPELARFLKSFDWIIAWCRDESGHLGGLLMDLGVAHIHRDPFPRPDSGIHVTDHLIRTLEPLGRVAWKALPELVIPDPIQATRDELLVRVSLHARRFLAIHPGSGSGEKNWNPEHFAELARRAREHGLGVALVEGEADQVPIQRILRRLDWRPPVFASLDLRLLASVFSQAAAYVGNDSGVTHLAAAAGSRTWALFGPTDPRAWAPRGPHVGILPLNANPDKVWNTIRLAL